MNCRSVHFSIIIPTKNRGRILAQLLESISRLEEADDQLAKTFSETIFEGNPRAPASFDIALSPKDIDLATELGCRLNVPLPIAAMVEQFTVHTMNRG
jgi:3-hydroxyisobutyrate dehydrogenase-like beta-hydroxyacid dehydrogenase